MSSSKIQGIYRVTLSPTHFYVGRSSDIKRRLRDHLGLLKRGRHLNAYMQSVYNQFHHFDWKLLVACADAGEAVRASLKAHWERVRQGQAAHGKVKLGSTFSDVFV